MNSKRIIAMLIGGGLPLLMSPVAAQQAGGGGTAAGSVADGGLGDIVVTARKRAESLISVPVAVTALGSDDLQRYNATSLQQIAQLAPQLFITTAGTGHGATLSIRGVGSVSDDPGVDQSVGVYSDNVGIGRGRIIGVSQFDISQVEVLKGPQALFFGKNSPAGVVSITTAGPGKQFEAKVTGGYEFVANERYLEAAVGGPLSDSFGARLAVRGESMDGFIRNIARPILDPLTRLTTPGANDSRAPKQKRLAARLTLAYEPTSDLTVVAKLFGAYNKTNDPTAQIDRTCLPGVTFNVLGIVDPFGDCKINRVHAITGLNPALAANWPRTNGGVTYGKTNFLSGSVVVNYDLGDYSLTSVSAAGRLEYHDFFNASVSSFEALMPQANELTKTISQELRLNSDLDGPLNFTLGTYFERTTRDAPNSAMLLFLGPDMRSGTARNWNFTREAKNKSRTLSAFGQLRWEIVDDIEFAAGVRYTRDRKKARVFNSFVNTTAGSFTLLPEGTELAGTFTDSNWSPEATLTWHPTPDQTFYAAYKTGYKSGGFSNPLLLRNNFGLANITYAPETTKGFELGYKARLLDNHLRIETAVYRYKFKGLQLSVFDPLTFSYFIKNAAAARTTGAEVSGQWLVADGLTLRGNIAYNKAKFLDYPGALCYQGQTVAQGCTDQVRQLQNMGGKALPRAPKWTFDPGGTFELPLTGDLTLGLDADAQFKTSFFTDSTDAPFPRQSKFWLFNASMRLTSEAMGWQLSLIGRNLSDKLYVLNTSNPAFTSVGVWNPLVERGRQIVLQASVTF